MIFQEDIKLPKEGNIRCFLPKRKAAELLIVFRQIDVMRERERIKLSQRPGV